MVNYLLFLAALSWYNLIYAFVYMGVDQLGFLPLTSLPLPYKYLMAVGFYFYLKHQIDPKHKTITRAEYLLFAPAVVYGFLRTYWYVRIHFLGEDRLFREVYDTGFFTYNELTYLLFSGVVVLQAMRFLKSYRPQISGNLAKLKNWDWLLNHSRKYAIFILLNLVHQVAANLFGLQDSGLFYYLILLLNTTFIYYIGYVGFTKSDFLFSVYELKDQKSGLQLSIRNNLEHLMEKEEKYTQANLKLSDLAANLQLSEAELSTFIQENYHCTFPDFLNGYRVEKVKALLSQPNLNKFTLVALAQQAGFSSKSTFYTVFKKFTGLTPSEFKKNNG